MQDESLTALRDLHLLVIGLGDLGGTFAAHCARAGAVVTGVRRGPGAPPGVTLVRMDARSAADLARLPDTFDAAVLCVTPSSSDEAGYRASYLAIAEAFAQRWRGGAIDRVLWVSSTAVHAQADGAEVEDASPAEPTSFRGTVLLEAEAALRASGLPVTAVRLSGIYGPGRTALLKRVLEGRGEQVDPPHFTNRIHRDDAAAILAFLIADHGGPPPEVVLATDPHPTPRHEVLGWLAERLRVELRVPEAPGLDRAPSRRMMPRWLLDAGYRFQHPDYRSGFDEMITAMEGSGELNALREAVRRPH